MPNCDGCGDSIAYMKVGDKKAPVELEEHEGFVIPNTIAAARDWKNIGLRVVRGFTKLGETKTVVIGSLPGAETAKVRESHHANCPEKNRFENPRR